ncbi:MAG: hypothetical protein GY816_03865 [Cytophagales bacterium]|nr:hypothetical protein [Cytophagales bacterium]
MNKLRLIGLYALVMVTFSAQAQQANCCDGNLENGWCWGATDPDKAKEKNALYTDSYKAKSFEAAATDLEWLLENTPCLNKSIYINGSKIYENLANVQEDAAKKTELIDKTLSMYDLRIKYFNDEPDVLNRKAYVAYKLLKNDQSRYQELLDLYDRAYELNGNNLLPNNLLGYMDVMRRYKAAGNEFSDEDVLNRYFGISDIMDFKESKGTPVSKTIKDNVEKLLLIILPDLDCEIVINDFGPKLEANPEDIKLAKKIFQLMLQGKCTDDPLAMKAAKIVDDNEPSYGIKIFIAGRSLGNDDKATALVYFSDALELTNENVKKADIYLKIAKIKRSQGLKSGAREHANKALSMDPSMKDAYKLIGDLYMSSFDDCAEKDDIVLDRAVFIAARDMYRRAGAAGAAAKAKAQFPSIGEIFDGEYEEGQSVKVNCWINTTVKLERRPSN